MRLSPLTQTQAEELVCRWLTDQAPVDDPADLPTPAELAEWLDWHTSDLAFVVDLTLPPGMVTAIGAARIEVPRFDVPATEEASATLVEAASDLTELRLLVDRQTGQVAAAERAAPVPHLLELWRTTKGLDDELGRLPAYDPRFSDSPGS